MIQFHIDNPIDLRDLVTDEPNGFVTDCAIRELIARGWPAEAILAEMPTVSEADYRRICASMTRDASASAA